MAAPFDRGALIGPAFAADIKRTIERVAGMPYDASGITKIPTDLGGETPDFQRIARGTFTPPWSKGSTATVTDADGTTTRTATNYFASLTGSGTKACCIAFVAGEWILIAAEC